MPLLEIERPVRKKVLDPIIVLKVPLQIQEAFNEYLKKSFELFELRVKNCF